MYLYSFFIIQTLQSRLEADGSRPIVAYFFLSFTSVGKFDVVKALILDLISQICQQVGAANVPERVRTLLSSPDERRSRDYLMETIRYLSRSTDRRTFVVLDGLDECDQGSVPEVIQIIKDLMENTRKVSILLSHRNHPEIVYLETKLCPAFMSLHDTRGTDDIDKYILTRLERFQMSAEQKALIHQELSKTSGG